MGKKKGVSRHVEKPGQNDAGDSGGSGEETGWCGYEVCGVRVTGRTLTLTLTALALLCGALHNHHLSVLFENDRHFSHLSQLEREMCFRTEMGMYYTYYKQVVTADTMAQGLLRLMYDNGTEYPNTINTLRRFNIYPELVLGAGYRLFQLTAESLGYKTKICWKTERGKGLSPIISCEGWGDREYFYVNSVFIIAATTTISLFLLATLISGDALGGVLSVLCFFYNHGECTRVQWTPPLRESFGYPLCLLQMLLLSWTLRSKSCSKKQILAISLTITSFMCSWQFAQFMLATQVLALCTTYILGYGSRHMMANIFLSHMFGLLGGYVMLFGNTMLLTSIYAATLPAAALLLVLEPVFSRISIQPIAVILQSIFTLASTVIFKLGVSRLLNVKDDAHIMSILRAKFTSYSDFHTKLYTCAAEFDFLPSNTYLKLTKSLLLPCATLATLVLCLLMARQVLNRWTGGSTSSKQQQHESEHDTTHEQLPADLVYHVFQLGAFSIMSAVIMRLKLFWTPHLCLMTSLLATRSVSARLGSRIRHLSILALVIAFMSVEGLQNLKDQRSILGDYSNVKMEELFTWIQTNTNAGDVFAGAMPTMANVHLSTGRPVVIHPHYEDAAQRERTKQIYQIFSRKPVSAVHELLVSHHVDYVLLERNWCASMTRDPRRVNCTMVSLWDAEDEENRGKETFCFEARVNAEPHFTKLMDNDEYAVLRVNDVKSGRKGK